MAWIWAEEIDENEAFLSADEVRHLGRVLRRASGTEVSVLDGRGRRGKGVWTGEERVELRQVETMPAPAVELILGLGSRNSNEEALRRAAEMGVRRVRPVLCARSRDAGARTSSLKADRIERILRSGCAQSGNAWLPAVDPVLSWEEAVAEIGRERIVALSPEATDSLSAVEVVEYVAVGPEGGWAPGEIEGCRTASLGPYVLRTHVAVAAMLGAVLVKEEATCAV